MMTFQVILYYNFSFVAYPKQWVKRHKEFCQEQGLLGRVYIATEGINGTLSGSVKAIAAYQAWLRRHAGFENTAFKVDVVEANVFERLIVKERPEIVALRSSLSIDMTHEKGQHLSPAQWRAVIESDEPLQMIDVRNNYESKIGHFKGAIMPDVKNFYDFEEWLDQAKLSKDKKTLMYCTGGIRCEKFSVLMEKKGFKDVFQLDGGIINYAQSEGGEHFLGKCFVFDDRLQVPITDDQPLTQCEITGEPCDTYINCANVDCNKLFICSEAGAKQLGGCCSEECTKSTNKRLLDDKNYSKPFRKWYHYFSEEQWQSKRNHHERT